MSIVASLFDGIGTSYHILENLFDYPIKKYITFEIDPVCNDVAKTVVPPNILEQLGDISDPQAKKYLKNKYNHIDWILCGSPCCDLSTSKANSVRHNLEGKQSSLFWDAIDILKMYPNCKFMFENVSTMNKNSWNRMTEALEEATNRPVYSILLDASLWKPMKRKRWFWTNFPTSLPLEHEIESSLESKTLEKYLLPRDKRPRWDMDMQRAGVKNEKILGLAHEWLNSKRMEKAKSVVLPCMTRALSKKGSSSEAHRNLRTVAEAMLKSGRIEEWLKYPRMLLLEEALGLFGFPRDYFNDIIAQEGDNPKNLSRLWSHLYDSLCNSWDIDSVVFVLQQGL